MTAFTDVIRLVEPWARLYGNTPLLQMGTAFAHFGGLLLGGGFAIAADSATLRAARGRDTTRRRQLAHIRGTHRVVIAGLVLTLASGLLMFTADVETLAVSPVFWAKISVVALLLVNGGMIVRTESALRSRGADAERGWQRMRSAAIRSIALWFAAVLIGTLLVNVAP